MMERLTVAILAAWYWARRDSVMRQHYEAARSLSNARTYLMETYRERASTRSRGYLLQEQIEALELLHAAVEGTLERRHDYRGPRSCYRRVRAELGGLNG